MCVIDPPGTKHPSDKDALDPRSLPEPPTSQALWPTFMRRTIAAEPTPRQKAEVPR
jgi:hypothetical protein